MSDRDRLTSEILEIYRRLHKILNDSKCDDRQLNLIWHEGTDINIRVINIQSARKIKQ